MSDQLLVCVKLVDGCRHANRKFLAKLLPKIAIHGLFLFFVRLLLAFEWKYHQLGALDGLLLDIDVVDDIFHPLLPTLTVWCLCLGRRWLFFISFGGCLRFGDVEHVFELNWCVL